MYIGDKLENEIEKWNKGDFIYIRAGTGQGKTYFVNNQLREYALPRLERILFLCPRTSLRENIHSNIDPVLQNVDCLTYQKVIYDYKQGELDYLGSYDYVVLDEFATFINDSTFNPEVEDIFSIVMNLESTRIFMAADGDLYINEIAKLYNIRFRKYLFEKSDVFLYDVFDRVNTAYTYKKDDTISARLSKILSETDDKIICFINNNKSIEKLYSEFKDESMIYVSEGSPLRKLMDKQKNEYMFSKGTFEDRILFTTSAIISGVSFKDRDIKHIIIDEKNIHSIYQMMSRKRLLDRYDTFDLYLKEVSGRSIFGLLRSVQQQLDTVDFFNNNYEDFLQQENRQRHDNKLLYFDDVSGEITLNNIRVIVLKEQERMYEEMRDGGFIAVVEGNLNLFTSPLEEVESMEKLEVFLEQYTDRKLFVEDQQEISDFLATIISNSKSVIRGKRLSVKSMEQIIREDFKLDYAFSKPKAETKGENRNRKYVLLTKLR